MLSYGTLRACIRVDGQALETYGIETFPEENKVTCWIASEAGKTFSIVWQDINHARQYHQTGDVTLDGVHGGGQLMRALRFNEPPTYQRCTAEFKYVSTSMNSIRPLTFSRLQLTGQFHLVLRKCAHILIDEDQHLNSAHAELGEISLAIWPVNVIGMGYQRKLVSAEGTMVHERSKKASSHCVGFGEEIRVPPQQVINVARVGIIPTATFVFRYRPFDRLVADGIAPPPMQPSRGTKREAPVDVLEPEDHNDATGLDIDDEALRELNALKAQVRRLEERISTTRSGKRVKIESSGTMRSQ
ncbi:uncharacterized protein BJ212DRAFT_1547943 [Suillus subaureus]|uniref:DUF7918 domain-containing protein n=1 Tax=Suillus subaureus TaxID=48587 RepID=A0A9P7EHG8_9AGAM|nr:uncharacterized protein BJ212DRAFT_1547943 [Suillus subaureus]KAG1821974.1 hypothetical protein BJ212DRAFT_1547943 [Suillus subaureus]